jgi:formylglycine-generating enzyme required for sulfatase activity
VRLAAALGLGAAAAARLSAPAMGESKRRPGPVLGFFVAADGEVTVLRSSTFSRFAYHLALRRFVRGKLGVGPVTSSARPTSIDDARSAPAPAPPPPMPMPTPARPSPTPAPRPAWVSPALTLIPLAGIGAVLYFALRGASDPTPGETFRDCPGCPEMVVMPAGAFTMGSPRNLEGRYPEENPERRVTIARRFALAKYEVTFDEWDACVSAGGFTHRPGDSYWGRGRRPVINLSWTDAKQYVAWLSRATGKAYRLPSEAEWEYAARAGSKTRYSWGDSPGANKANFVGSGSLWDRKTAPVGSFEANAFGLHDMHGNAIEWVEDCWNDTYAMGPTDGRPWRTGPNSHGLPGRTEDCWARVARGGSWSDGPEVVRSAARTRLEVRHRDPSTGFRVARDLD